MRQIFFDQSGLYSPIRHIVQIMHQPLIRIAPEMETAFEEEYQEFSIECINADRMILNVDTQRKYIKISTLYIELLWCFGYIHYRYYQRFVDATLDPETDVMEPIVDHDSAADFRLLSWIIAKALNQEDSTWPENCPRPIENPSQESDHHIAEEFCLGGLACLLHHELNHIRLRHEGPSDIEIERDADLGAWGWILPEGFDVSSSAGRKRLLMIVQAYLIPVVLNIHCGSFPSESHPPSYDRLASALSRLDTGDYFLAHSFAYAVIHLHISNCGGRVPMYELKEHDDHKEAFEFQINHLARFAKQEI